MRRAHIINPFSFTVLLVCMLSQALLGSAQQPQNQTTEGNQPQANQEDRKTVEPVFRVSKRTTNENEESPAVPAAETKPQANVAAVPVTTDQQAHPLDKAVTMAHASLAHMRANVNDYTAIMVKRERVNDVLGDRNFMQLKVRSERTLTNGVNTPFSVYMKFLKPKSQAGREVIWVKGQNNNKLIAHEGSGLGSFKTFKLDPSGWVAMRGNRYPIYEAGIENLIIKLIEKAERDRKAGDCKCEYRTGAMINKRPCTMIELTHATKRAPYEFHKAEVFIDDELQLPIRYAAYDWPATPGGQPRLIEEYTYVNVKLNVGLSDVDFDPKNPAYKYPN